MHEINYFIDPAKASNKISPPAQSVNIGSRASFRCNSSGSTYWLFSSSSLPPKQSPLSTRVTLTIATVALHHMGHYFCFGVDSDTSEYFLAKSELKVYGELNMTE